MATRSLVPLEDLITIRDNLVKTLIELNKVAVSQYSFQERQVLYEQRSSIRAELNAYDRKIALADKSINATGLNKADLFDFNTRSRGG